MAPPLVLARLLLIAAMCAAAAPAVAQEAPLATRAEITNYEETSSYEDVQRIVAGLATSPLVHVETFGQSEEGRDLPLLVISDPKVEDALKRRAAWAGRSSSCRPTSTPAKSKARKRR